MPVRADHQEVRHTPRRHAREHGRRLRGEVEPPDPVEEVGEPEVVVRADHDEVRIHTGR